MLGMPRFATVVRGRTPMDSIQERAEQLKAAEMGLELVASPEHWEILAEFGLDVTP